MPPCRPAVLGEALTDEVVSRGEPGGQILRGAVVDGDGEVLEEAREVVGTAGGDVQQGCDPQALQ